MTSDRKRTLLVTRLWPLCFALYLLTSTLYTPSGDRHPLGDTILDGLSCAVIALLVLSAWRFRSLGVRALAGVGVVAVSLMRAAWLLDPAYLNGARTLSASMYLLTAVSALGWAMAADFVVVSQQVAPATRRTGRGGGS